LEVVARTRQRGEEIPACRRRQRRGPHRTALRGDELGRGSDEEDGGDEYKNGVLHGSPFVIGAGTISSRRCGDRFDRERHGRPGSNPRFGFSTTDP
jgi:hypothetical protein